MNKKLLNSVAEDLLAIPPLIRRGINRKVVKAAFDKVGEGIGVPHFEIMMVLEEAGTQHITEIGEKLLISRPQMTFLIDRLVSLEMVARRTDETDRRLSNISLTDKGKAILKEKDQVLRANFTEKLSRLTDDELQQLAESLKGLKNILSRL
ncbi:MAG TPA: MarR family transcriptional regulator [Dehalococcoidia bacterium]|nr:MarR family transcriptional regulator [Dehalococcoidia bacterium]